jgi:hypothetical protein
MFTLGDYLRAWKPSGQPVWRPALQLEIVTAIYGDFEKWRLIHRNAELMADIRTANPEDDVGCDV